MATATDSQRLLLACLVAADLADIERKASGSLPMRLAVEAARAALNKDGTSTSGTHVAREASDQS